MSRTERYFIGRTLHDTYRIESCIGSGGMGTVFAGVHTRLGNRVAIKVLSQDACQSPNAVTRFEREAVITSSLGHPNIVKVFDFNETGKAPYLVMELLEGDDLARRFRSPEPIPIAMVAAIVEQTASALQAAHENKIVHRDLKPSNIFLCREQSADRYRVKVLDFGISKVVGAGSDLTRTDRPIGTPAYMAPEQATGDRTSISARTDLFALAVITYRMLAGRLPFDATSIPHLMYEIAHVPAVPLESVRPDLPAELVEALHAGLSKDPDQRPAPISRFASAVVAGLRQMPPDAVAAPAREPPHETAVTRPASSSPTATTIPPYETAATKPAAGFELPEEAGASSALQSRPRRTWLLVGALAVVGLLLALLFTISRPRDIKVASAPKPPEPTLATAPTPPPSPDLGRDATSADARVAKVSETRRRRIKSRRRVKSRRRIKSKRRAARRSKRVKLHLATTSGGEMMWARVYLDGVLKGRSPLTIETSPGRHWLRFVRRGYRTIRKRVLVRSRDRHLSFRLRPR